MLLLFFGKGDKQKKSTFTKPNLTSVSDLRNIEAHAKNVATYQPDKLYSMEKYYFNKLE